MWELKELAQNSVQYLAQRVQSVLAVFVLCLFVFPPLDCVILREGIRSFPSWNFRELKRIDTLAIVLVIRHIPNMAGFEQKQETNSFGW